jgi:copper(I)-binding protein
MTTPRSVHRPHRSALAALLAVTALSVALLAACGDDDSTDAATSTEATSDIQVTEAWARTSPAVASAGAVYMEIANVGSVGDTLRSAAVDPSVAATVELHETVEEETSMSSTTEMGDDMTTTTGMGGGGMMSMQPVDEIPIPAGERVSLEPGGYHVMLLELVEPLEVGTTITVTLTFELFGDVEVTADVLDAAP